MTSDRICVGQFLGAHGVHGRVRVKSFTADPDSIFGFGPLTDESGARRFPLRRTGTGKDHFLCEVEGLRDRDQAEALKGVRLYVARDRLPELTDEDEFYHADLIGLATVTEAGDAFGTIKAIHDFGAGDMLEILHVSGKTVFVPFTRLCVPVVDVKAARIVVAPPENLFASAGPQPADMDADESLMPEPVDGDEAADGEDGHP